MERALDLSRLAANLAIAVTLTVLLADVFVRIADADSYQQIAAECVRAL